MKVVKLTPAGVTRVLDGQPGMTFVVDRETESPTGTVMHVRDYRYPQYGEYQIWSLVKGDYEVITDVETGE